MQEIRVPAVPATAQDSGAAVRSLLCVDLSNQVYKATSVNLKLTSGRTFTGGVFGFVHFLAKAITLTEATHVVICKDSPPYRRSIDYPKYKKIREANRDEEVVLKVKETKKILDGMFDLLGLPVLEVAGYESDDLIAHLAKKYRNRFGRIVAASNDSDLYQLFEESPWFTIYRGKKGFYDRSEFDQEWGLSRDQFMDAHALMGTHNDIEGIEGVGPARAKAIVTDPPKMRSYLASHGDLIERNKKLIELPHPTFDGSVKLPVSKRGFNEREFIRFMGRLEIKVSTHLLNSLERVLG